MAAKKRKDGDAAKKVVSAGRKAAEEAASRKKNSAKEIGKALDASKGKKNTPRSSRVPKRRSRSEEAAARRRAATESQAASRKRVEAQANYQDFLEDWFVDPSGRVLGEDPEHELTQLIRSDPAEATKIIRGYDISGLPEDFTSAVFGPTFNPEVEVEDERTGKKTTQPPGFIEETSVEQGLGRDLASADVDEYDPSQDEDYGDPARRKSAGYNLSDVLGKEGLQDVNEAEQQAYTEWNEDVDRATDVSRYTGVRPGLGPLTTGRMYPVSRPSGAVAIPKSSVVVPRAPQRLRRADEIKADINALKPSTTVEEKRLVDPSYVNMVQVFAGYEKDAEGNPVIDPDTGKAKEIYNPLVTGEESERVARQNPQAILTRTEATELANQGKLASPVPADRVYSAVQFEQPVSAEDLIAPDVPEQTGWVDQGVQSVGSARAEARIANRDRTDLGTAIIGKADVANRAGIGPRSRIRGRRTSMPNLDYRGTDQTTVTDQDTGGRRTVHVPRVKSVFEGTSVGASPEDTVTEAPEPVRLSEKTIEALKKSGWGGLFGGSLTQGGARIGRPQGSHFEGTRNGRSVIYNVDQMGNISQMDTGTGEVTPRPDISMVRAPGVPEDTPLAESRLELANPLDVSTIDPMSPDYMPKTTIGIPWSEMEDRPGQIGEIKTQQAEDLRKSQESSDRGVAEGRNPTPQSLIEGRTSRPRGTRWIRSRITKKAELSKPNATAIKMADRSTRVPKSQQVGETVNKIAAREGMNVDEVIESLSASDAYKNLIESYSRPTGVSAYKERIYESTVPPGGTAPSMFPTRRATVRTRDGRSTTVEVNAPMGGDDENVNYETIVPESIRPPINSPEETALRDKLGFFDPKTKTSRFYTPTAEETAAWETRQQAATAASRTRVRSDAAKARRRRLNTPNQADVEAGTAWESYKDLRTGENARVDTLGFLGHHLAEAAMYSNTARTFNPNVEELPAPSVPRNPGETRTVPATALPGAQYGPKDQSGVNPMVRTSQRTFTNPTSTPTGDRVNAMKLRTTGQPATEHDLRYHEWLRSKLPVSMTSNLYSKSAPVTTSTFTDTEGNERTFARGNALSIGEQDAMILAGAADVPNQGALGGMQFTPEMFTRNRGSGFSNDPAAGESISPLIRPVPPAPEKKSKKNK